MTQQPPVSVIITYFREVNYIHEAIASVMAQTYRPLEVILVDDGSPHPLSPNEIPNEVQYIRRKNGGVAAARNTGLDAIQHDWVCIMDGDDVWPSDRLEHMMKQALTSPQPDVVVGMVKSFISPDLDDEVKASLYCPPDLLRGLLPIGMLIHRRTFDVVGRFPDTLDRHDSMDWVARLVARPVVVSDVSEVVLHRRVHSTNESHNRGVQYARYMRTLKAAIEERRSGTGTNQ